MTKTVHLLRHAQSLFNQIHEEDGTDPMLFDAPLSGLGCEQVAEARAAFAKLRFDIIIVSPLTRALQTAVGIFGTKHAPMHVEALHREYLDHSCDVGRPPDQLADDFPALRFDQLEDRWWWYEHEQHNHPDTKVVAKEPMEHFENRVATFRAQLAERPEGRILAVGHGMFFRHLTNGRPFTNCEMVEVDLQRAADGYLSG